MADVTAEFPSADLLLGDYGNAMPPFAIVQAHFVEEIIDMTAQGLNPGDVYSSREKHAQILRMLLGTLAS